MSSRANPAGIHPLDRAAIEQIVAPLLARRGGKLKLFGSRARGDARRASDIDLALVGAQSFSPDELARARDALENSRIPFRVDLVDYSTASPTLRASIDREGIAWPA
jgi:predicted nucleotidyltransferase